MSSEWSRVQAAADLLKQLEQAGFTPAHIHSMTSGEGQEHLPGFLGVLCRRCSIVPLRTALEGRLSVLASDGQLSISEELRTHIVAPALRNPTSPALVGEPLIVPPNGGMNDGEIRNQLGEGHLFQAWGWLEYFVEGVENGTLPKGKNLYYVEGESKEGTTEVFVVYTYDDGFCENHQDGFREYRWRATARQLGISTWGGGSNFQVFPRDNSRGLSV